MEIRETPLNEASVLPDPKSRDSIHRIHRLGVTTEVIQDFFFEIGIRFLVADLAFAGCWIFPIAIGHAGNLGPKKCKGDTSQGRVGFLTETFISIEFAIDYDLFFLRKWTFSGNEGVGNTQQAGNGSGSGGGNGVWKPPTGASGSFSIIVRINPVFFHQSVEILAILFGEPGCRGNIPIGQPKGLD